MDNIKQQTPRQDPAGYSAASIGGSVGGSTGSTGNPSSTGDGVGGGVGQHFISSVTSTVVLRPGISSPSTVTDSSAAPFLHDDDDDDEAVSQDPQMTASSPFATGSKIVVGSSMARSDKYIGRGGESSFATGSLPESESQPPFSSGGVDPHCSPSMATTVGLSNISPMTVSHANGMPAEPFKSRPPAWPSSVFLAGADSTSPSAVVPEPFSSLWAGGVEDYHGVSALWAVWVVMTSLVLMLYQIIWLENCE